MGASASALQHLSSSQRDKLFPKDKLIPELAKLLGNEVGDTFSINTLVSCLEKRTDVFLTHNW
jgi:hypothetical protein